MQLSKALLLLSLVVCACASRGAGPAAVSTDEGMRMPRTSHADARLGPPSARGLGLRRIDRPLAAEASLVRY